MIMKKIISVFFLFCLIRYINAQQNSDGLNYCPYANLFNQYKISDIKKLPDSVYYPEGKVYVSYTIDSSNCIKVFLINKTDTITLVNRNAMSNQDDIFVIQEAQDIAGNWIPIEHFYTDQCVGPSWYGFEIPQGYYLRLNARKYEGNFETQIRFKVKVSNGFVYSFPFKGKINKAQFEMYLYEEIDSLNKQDRIEVLKRDDISDVEQAEQAYLKAIINTREKKYISSLAYCDLATKLAPNFGKAHMLKGNIYLLAWNKENCDMNLTDECKFSIMVCAAVEEWEKARKDEEYKDFAEEQIEAFRKYLPEKTCLENLENGDKYKIECWINNTISIKFKN